MRRKKLKLLTGEQILAILDRIGSEDPIEPTSPFIKKLNELTISILNQIEEQKSVSDCSKSGDCS